MKEEVVRQKELYGEVERDGGCGEEALGSA